MSTVKRALRISRIDEDQRMVYGIAATEQEASDGLIVTLEALRDAWDDYMRFANVREMHQEIAAGTVQEYRFDELARQVEIGVKVSDPTTWQKVKEGALKGFSILGDIIAQVGNVVSKLRLIEISLVDRPADEGALITLFRAAGVRDETTNNRGAEAPEGGEMPNPKAPQAGQKEIVKRDAAGDGGAGGGDISQEIAGQEGSPLDTQLDVIGLLMQEFGKIKDLVDSLSSGDGVHPDVLANCMRAHQALGRAINSHVSATTAYGKKDGEGEGEGEDGAGEGAGEGEGGATPPAQEDGPAKRAASISARNAAIKRATNGALAAQVEKLTGTVEALLKRSADPRSGYAPAVAPLSAPDAGKLGEAGKQEQVKRSADEFGPVEGTPEFQALSRTEQLDVVCRRANPTIFPHKS